MIQSEASEITYLIRDSEFQLPVRLCFLESGLTLWERKTHFDHPVPPFNRVFHFRTGGCRIRFSGGVRQLAAGRLYLLPASLSFAVDYRAGSELRFFHIQFQDLAGLDVFREANDILDVPHGGDLAREIADTFPGDGALRLRWQSALLQAVCRVGAPHLSRLQPKLDHARRYFALLDYIRLQCNAGMTVGELAERYRQPRAALSKGFQRCFGVPLKKHLQTVLLQRAKERLAGTVEKIQEVALDLGFDDTYYFFRFFKRHTGQTPLSYRQQMSMRAD